MGQMRHFWPVWRCICGKGSLISVSHIAISLLWRWSGPVYQFLCLLAFPYQMNFEDVMILSILAEWNWISSCRFTLYFLSRLRKNRLCWVFVCKWLIFVSHFRSSLIHGLRNLKELIKLLVDCLHNQISLQITGQAGTKRHRVRRSVHW